MERVTGNDPVSTVWKTVALPLSYARIEVAAGDTITMPCGTISLAKSARPCRVDLP